MYECIRLRVCLLSTLNSRVLKPLEDNVNVPSKPVRLGIFKQITNELFMQTAFFGIGGDL